MSVRGFRGCKPLKASLGLRSAATAAMEPTPAIALGPRTLAQGPATGPGLAPLTLPVWAVKPWFGIGFHCAHISSVYGVLLYPILDGFARHAWLGPRTADRAKPSNPNLSSGNAIVRTWVRALWSDSAVALGSRSTGLGKMVQEPRARFKVAKWGVFCHSAWLQSRPTRLK